MAKNILGDRAAVEARIIELYQSGVSMMQIAKDVGRSASGVHLILTRKGLHKSKGKPDKVTAAEKTKVLELHNQGLSISQIANRIGRSQSGVHLILVRDHGHETNPHEHLAEDVIQSIVKEYAAGVPSSKICNRWGIDKSTVGYWINKHSVKPHGRRKKANERAFAPSQDGTYSEQQKYWAGLLLADGSISDGKRRKCSIKLAMIDRDHIEKFRDFLGAHDSSIYAAKPKTTGPITSNKPVYEIRVSGSFYLEDLAKLGVYPRKTYTAEVPKHLLYDRHFWRGLVDGDGYVFSGQKPSIGICGTVEVARSFSQLVSDIVVRSKPYAVWVHPRKSNFGTCKVAGKAGAIVAEWIYGNAQCFLDRKIEKARQYVERYGLSV